MALFHFGIAHGDPRRPRRGSPPCLLGVMSVAIRSRRFTVYVRNGPESGLAERAARVSAEQPVELAAARRPVMESRFAARPSSAADLNRRFRTR